MSLSLTRSGRATGSSGVYSWLIELKNLQILFEDCSADKFSSTCFGREKVWLGLSPGRAAIVFTCFIHDKFLELTRSACLARNLVVASLSLSFNCFFNSLYFVLFPFFEYSLFFLLLACLTAAQQIFPSRLVVFTCLVGQKRSRLKLTMKLKLIVCCSFCRY